MPSLVHTPESGGFDVDPASGPPDTVHLVMVQFVFRVTRWLGPPPSRLPPPRLFALPILYTP